MIYIAYAWDRWIYTKFAVMQVVYFTVKSRNIADVQGTTNRLESFTFIQNLTL